MKINIFRLFTTHLWTKISCCFLMLLCASSVLQAQYWERSYEDEFLERAPVDFVHNTTDDGFILIGKRSVFPDNRKAYLMKIFENGEINWLNYYEPIDFNVSLTTRGSALTNDNGIICSFISVPSNTPWERVAEIVKFDALGDVEWAQQYSFDFAGDMIVGNSGTYFLSGYNNHYLNFGASQDSLQLIQLNASGALIWSKTYPWSGTKREYNADLVQGANGEIIISGYTEDEMTVILLKTDANGDAIWKQSFDNLSISPIEEMILANNGDLILVGDMAVARFDTDGNLLWNQALEGGAHDVKELANGNIVVMTEHDPDPSSITDFLYIQLNTLTASGDLLSTNPISRAKYLKRPRINLYPNDDYLISISCSPPTNSWDSIPYLMRTDAMGVVFHNKIQGQIANDENDNCIVDSNEFKFRRWFVSATGASQTFYGVTNESGNYCIEVDTGNYIVEVLPRFDYWEACEDSIFQEIMMQDTINIDFAMQGIADCPLMTVDIASWGNGIRRCAYSPFFVHYCNDGTIPGEEAFIEVTFDDDIQVDSASLMWTAVNDQTYTFDLGTINIGECGDFVIHTTLDPTCDSTMLDETRCVEAHIFPDTLCFPTPDWDGSSIEVNASCIDDSIHFYIQNVGIAPMSEALDYIVIEDNIMRDQGDFFLAPQSIKELVFEASGSTMRIEAEQANDHPGYSMPSITIEGCDPDGDGQFSTGFFTQWPMDDANPFLSIECLRVVGPFDPNDKQANPVGVGPELLIEPNTDLEYHIRFQNIGNDTAFNVVVLDTLSPFLDLTSIQLGASSFPFNFAVLPNRVLQFTFNQINLLPEEVDEIASQGFVKFRISQVPNNPIGTFISNSAAIYFDSNDPIITNFTFHQVGIPELISSLSNAEISNIISIFPNPFDEKTQLFIHDPKLLEEPTLLTLYNARGQMVSQQKITNQTHTIYRSLLPSGLYFYTISQKQYVATGKMIIQ